MLARQREVAQQNNADRITDLDNRLTREIEDIQMRYKAEQEAILATMDVAQRAAAAMIELQYIISSISSLEFLSDPFGFLSKMMGAKGIMAGLPESKQAGGAVSAGQPYWVGEGGERELFVPKTAGTLVPASQVSTSYGGHTFNFTINGARDPKETAEEIRRTLEDMPWQ
jgi:hypothetical protein